MLSSWTFSLSKMLYIVTGSGVEKGTRFCIGNSMVSSAIWEKTGTSEFFKYLNIARVRKTSAIWDLWKTYECFFLLFRIARETMLLLINNIQENVWDKCIYLQLQLRVYSSHSLHLRWFKNASLLSPNTLKVVFIPLNIFCSFRRVGGTLQAILKQNSHYILSKCSPTTRVFVAAIF